MEMEVIYVFQKLASVDLELVLEIQNVLREQFGERASDMLVKSDFLNMLKKNREYVYHCDTLCWAEAISDNYNIKHS